MTESSFPSTFRKMRVRSVAEWRAEGLTAARLRSLVRSGDLVRVWHSVYATRSAAWAKASPARSHALLVIAARAAVGRDSVASHQSAALIHGLDLFPSASDKVILTRPTTRRSGRRRSQDIFFHAAKLPDEHVTTLLGARVTTVARTVVDLARVSTFMSAVVTADSALRSECGITKAALLAVCDACAGWPGIRKARQAVDFADPRAESVLESCARVIFHEHGIEPPELQFTITGPDFRYSVDFYWPKHRVAAEADGDVKYSDPRRAIRQLERDQRLRDHGEKVVHFTWRELFKTPRTVTGRLRKAFASPTSF
jgi:hypothetical protein